jgi:hypothetical protein
MVVLAAFLASSFEARRPAVAPFPQVSRIVSGAL